MQQTSSKLPANV